jgi:hypothetical protein
VARDDPAEIRAATAGSILLAVACLISYWLTTRVVSLVFSVNMSDDALGGLWAVVAAWLGVHAVRRLIWPLRLP